MKKYLLLFVSIFLISSCSSDEDSTPVVVVEPSLFGSWKIIKGGTIINNVENLIDYQNNCPTKFDHVIYLENGIGKQVTHDTDCNETIVNYTYTINNNNIITTGNISTEILELTNSILVTRTLYNNIYFINKFQRI